MNISNGSLEDSIILEKDSHKMFITKKDVGCYVFEIKKDKDNKRVFTISNCCFMDMDGLRVHEIFEEFIASIFGNNVLHEKYKDSKLLLDFSNKTITILSDSNNGAVLRIVYTNEEIKIEIVKLNKDGLNSAIYLYNDSNLRGGYIGAFRELFEKLNNLALELNNKETITR